jgi:hypothetical protein
VPDRLNLCTLKPGGYIELDDGARIAFDGKGYGLRSPEQVASLACLAYAFYHAYRRGVVVCVGEDCDVSRSLRYRRIALWLVTLVVCLLLTAPWWANWVIYWTL